LETCIFLSRRDPIVILPVRFDFPHWTYFDYAMKLPPDASRQEWLPIPREEWIEDFRRVENDGLVGYANAAKRPIWVFRHVCIANRTPKETTLAVGYEFPCRKRPITADALWRSLEKKATNNKLTIGPELKFTRQRDAKIHKYDQSVMV
jgi:hypothetical protein